ncbi:MAG: TetR family transcriptional regulator [bacterium]
MTRQTILEHAAALASQVGLEGLSFGRLAEDLNLSKSGLFAHFKSLQALQIKVLEHAADRFAETVVRPALKAPRGAPRLRALFEYWRRWPKASRMAGGCFFVAAATELDDRPGPVRDLLVNQQKDWLDTLATVVRGAIAEGHFHKQVDPEQFVYELYGIMLAYHYAVRLLADPKAERWAETAFAFLMERSQR